MAYTEFYVDNATGSNVNAGDNKTVVTSTNGDWGNAAANRFTAAAGTPFSGVSVGDFASVYLDGATATVMVGRVTAVNAGGASLDISTTWRAGTAPANGATGRSCTVGGKWAGPSGAVGFPFTLASLDLLTDSSNHMTRVNVKGGTTYSVTASISSGVYGNQGLVIEGYTTSPGDGGRFTLDGGTSGASYALLVNNFKFTTIRHAALANNGASGAANGLELNQSGQHLEDVVVHDVRGSGIAMTAGGGAILYECEVYNANQSNTAGKGGFETTIAGDGRFVRCVAHDNAGANTAGFYGGSGGAQHYTRCIADTNGGVGFYLPNSTTQACSLVSCDAYNNGSDGALGRGTPFYVENSNFVKNGGYGINTSGAAIGRLVNCGFGAGTQANTSGQTNLPTAGCVTATGSVTYAADVTPWADPANGDFRINLAAAKGAGRGAFTQTAASYAGTVAYPDIGAAQHQDSGGAAGMLFVPNLDGV